MSFVVFCGIVRVYYITRGVKMAYKIDASGCVNCGACEPECPVSAISEGDGVRVIDASACIDCGACVGVCPTDVISPD